ncbi:MAG: type II secretion system protein GspD [Gemmatimonadales bacterium]
MRHPLWAGLALTLLTSFRLAAQEPEPVRVTEQGVLVDFQDADLRLVLTALGEAGGLNLIYGELPARRVTLRMRQPVPTANLLALVRSLAQSNGLRLVEEGEFYRLEPAGPAEARDGQPTSQAPAPDVRLYVHRLKHARASRLGATLQSLFGPGGQGAPAAGSEPVPLSRSLPEQALTEPPGEGREQVSVEMGPVRAGIPGQLRGEVQIVPDEATNSLLVRARAEDWEILRQAIESLDLRPLQVVIEVVIAEVRRTRDLETSLSGRGSDSKTNPSVRGTLRGATTGDLLLEALRFGSLDLSLALSVLSSRGDLRIISRPVILAQNNQEARILVGSERPFVQVSRSLPTDAAVRDQVIQYRDVGTKLTITPTINDDGYVNLQVLQEVSTATAETQFGAPVISTREAATHLFIRNGRTAVLGGLIDQQQERSRSGIPILMDLPLVGGLFGTARTGSATSELFLFLTPHVVATDDDSDRVRETLEQGAPLLRGALEDEGLRQPAQPVERNPLQP